VLNELGFTGPAIATALNGQFVPREARQTTALKSGDQLEVLAPMQGG
jgi:sulfur carrier protein